MWRATVRSLLAHKLRLALSGLAIVLGVAFVSGTMIFTDTLAKTFDNLFTSTSADVNVEPKAAFETGLTGTASSAAVSYVPEAVVRRIAAVDGVSVAEGYVQAEGVYILQKDGSVLDTGGAPGLGVDMNAGERLSPNTLTEGRAPSGPGEIALDTGAVEKTGYRIGDTVALLTPGPRIEARLVGVFRFGKSGGLAGATLTAFDTATAQQLLAKPGEFNGVSVGAADGVSNEALRDRVAAALGPGYDVKTKQQQADDLSTSFAQGLSFVNIFLLVFAGIALFVGTFIILNTFSMLVAQRTRELALLRALGAGRGQVTRSVLGEALALGVAGSTVGVLAGFGIASALRALFGTFGLTLDGSLVLAADTVLWSFAVGVLVTLVAAYLPARRASRVAPVAAMRDDVAMVERSLRRRTAAGLVLALVAVALLAAGLRSDDGSTAATRVGLGAVALVVAAIALSPVLARPFVRAVGSVLPRLWGRTGHLARENALRNPRRTAATASALMVGLALVSAFSVIGASTNASVDALVDKTLGADYVVSSAVQQPFTPEVAQALRRVDGVDAVMQLRIGLAELDGKQQTFAAVQPETLDRTVRLDYVSGSTQGLGDGLLVDEATAKDRGWAVGTPVKVLLPTGQQRSPTVRGVYAVNQALGPVALSVQTFTELGGAQLDRFLFVDVANGADGGAVRSALEKAVAPFPVVKLKDQSQFKEEQKGQVNQLLLLINAMLVLSVIIAILGIVNTLALSVIERTREIGLLRAIGMARSQLRRMVRLESVVLSLYGAVLGLVLGLVFGVSLARVLAQQGIEELVVPGWRLAGLLVVAAVIGVLAAVWPARRAARMPVLEAISTD